MKLIKIDGRRKVGVTADTHIHHANIIQYCLRPFLSEAERARVVAGEKIRVSPESVAAHDNAIINRTNELLGPDDTLIHAGDVAFGEKNLREYRRRLNVKDVYVVCGNHDDDDLLADVFGADHVFERVAIMYANQLAIIDHYPGDSWRDGHKKRGKRAGCPAWQIFGHVHGRYNKRRRQFPGWLMSVDAGVDSHDFRPWLWRGELDKFMAKREKEWEAWAAEMYTGRDRGGMAPDGEP